MDDARGERPVRPSLAGMESQIADVRRRLDVLRAGIRRGVLSHRRLLAALLMGTAVLAGLRAVAPPAPPTVAVLVAAEDLPAGRVLTSDDLLEVPWAEGTEPSGAVEDPVGDTLASPVRRGEPLTDVRLVGPGLLRAGADEVALPVRIPDAQSVGLLEVGDRIDLVAGDPASHEPVGTTVARGVLVLALPSGGSAGSAATGPIGPAGSGRLVVVALTPEVAESVVGHAARGLLAVALSK